jgi:hypothetical protein
MNNIDNKENTTIIKNKYILKKNTLYLNSENKHDIGIWALINICKMSKDTICAYKN